MTFDTAYMITALVTMFVVIDPIAHRAALSCTDTGHEPRRTRTHRLALGLVGGLSCSLFAFFGEAVLGLYRHLDACLPRRGWDLAVPHRARHAV